ncbi:MAG: hypothetical protein JW917_03400 [Ignavibacteria bacterium]|nr:hypothetical protein [Ignavibacteria bacterium]
MQKRRTRFDYILNEIKIMDALSKILKEKGRKPSTSEISKESGVGKRTVIRHLRNYSSIKALDDFRILTSKVIMSLFQKAEEGRAPEVKLWMELVENMKELEKKQKTKKGNTSKINFVVVKSKNNES